MAPPRTLDPASAGGGSVDAYEALCEEIARTQGVINLAEARLVELARQGLAMGVSGGTNLSPKAWLAWRAGISPERAGSFVKIAERAEQLPHTIAALDAGALTVDQAAVIARHIPVRYEESAARVAQSCTVEQLRKTLPHYRDRKPVEPRPESDPEAHGHISTRYDDSGYHLHLHLRDAAQGAIVDQALKAMHEDLRRQARADAPEGCNPQRVYAADAMVALAETALAAGEAARPGTDRYLVHVHLEAGPAGVQLMTHLGIALPDGERRHLLCDSRLRALVHDGTTPLGTGRSTRTINRRMRRAIEHRDGGCSVPGCGRSTGLEIHHIWHWEDGGPTETWNLIALCAHHHRCHHHGTLGITGNADHPRHTEPGVVFTNTWGHPLDPAGQPILPTPPEPGTHPAHHVAETATDAGIGTHTYLPPTGERLDRSGFHLIEADEPPPTDPADPTDAPPPDITGQRPPAARPAPTSPTGDTPIDPTRAGPDAA
ncbi:DUF222 domain-containing protein [Aquihabitans daechungensis]|uniref:HNH endonuclease signature motif containing protein n=1 Tax=Aquihabitans daechungensis TaxID=1052257 RepID=UPI003BA0401B